MRVVLLQDVENVGKKWDVCVVSDGFARNVLIPKGSAALATPAAMENAEFQQKKAAEAQEASLRKTQELASSIDGYELTVHARVNEHGELYAAIAPRQIVELLAKENFTVPAKAIRILEPIKRIGEYQIPLTFDHGLEVHIKVIVEELKEPVAE